MGPEVALSSLTTRLGRGQSMAVILWALGLSLLLQGCLCSPGQTDTGCMRWKQDGSNEADVCCEACYPGNRLVNQCGPDPKKLCIPCGPDKFTVNPKDPKCTRCTQCVGAQVLVKACTATTDTQCGCKEGLTCGDERCSFCVMKCGKGQEPTENRSCRPCPNGTFNDQIHQKCKPWSTKCPNPDQNIEAEGDAFNDIKCTDAVIVSPVAKPEKPAPTEHAWPVVLSAFSIVLMAIGFIIIFIVTVILAQRKKKPTPPTPKTPIRPPTDDPMTLIAVECSFHEAQQEQGSSTESLASKDSSKRLLS